MGWIYICPMDFFIVSGCDLMQDVVYLVWTVDDLTKRIVLLGRQRLTHWENPREQKRLCGAIW